jgi:hypothetical protein
VCLAADWVPPGTATGVGAVARAEVELGSVAAADAALLTTAEQAECLRQLERAEARLTAARAAILAAFTDRCGYQDDGHGSAKTWLAWQARTTSAAAAAAVGWARRLAAHPAVRDALASGAVSASWARQICDWTDPLPPASRPDADAILLAAAAAGADLAGRAGLAEEIRAATAQPDRDGDDGFEDRWVRVTRHWRGAARLDGDLTPQAAAALTAVLEALGKKAGPEDTRSKAQRDHDALEEACRRLIASGCLPDRAGQPTQIQLHMTLDQLRNPDPSLGRPGHDLRGQCGKDQNGGYGGYGGYGDPAAWTMHGLPPAGPGADCDAAMVPIVTGHIDPAVLDRLTREWLHSITPADTVARSASISPHDPGPDDPAPHDFGPSPAGIALLRDALVRSAADLLSGPAGLAAWLRTTQLTGPAAAVSLPLDTGTAADTIPPHLRRAVTARDRGCRFPGCDQPPPACHPHHLIPRARGGPTSLPNLLSLCSFHHLIAVHRWGWAITLHGDGTVTATSPDHTRQLASHEPPGHEPGHRPPGRAA